MGHYTVSLSEISDIVRRDALSSYPIFSEDYRDELNTKIIEYYWFYEIGFESVDMFVHQLRNRMNIIMPMYNRMYEADAIKLNPLSTSHNESTSTNTSRNTTDSKNTIKTVSKTDSKAITENESRTDAKSRAVNSETPQVRLAGNEDYATSAADSVSETVAGGSSSSSEDGTQTTDNDASTVAVNDSTGEAKNVSDGYSGNPAEIIAAYKAALVSTDLLVIAELETLFMSVWSSGDYLTEGI